MPITILIADDQTLFREALASLLAREPDLRLVGEAADGRAALQLARSLCPDVLLLDVSMPELNGIDACQRLRRQTPSVKVLALSAHVDWRFVERMLEAGAAGYAVKDSGFAALLGGIRCIMHGKRYLDPLVAQCGIAIAADGMYAPRLSHREQEVLQLLTEGLRNAEVAIRLRLSVKTVETHRARIMEKLGLGSLAALIKYAISEGLTSLDPWPRR